MTEVQPNLFGEDTVSGVLLSDVQEVFDFWKTTFNKRESTKLDQHRTTKIVSAIKLYGMEGCKKAILGCSMSAWHTGTNPGNKQYTDLTLIFRNAAKVEQFQTIYQEETAASTELDNWLNT